MGCDVVTIYECFFGVRGKGYIGLDLLENDGAALVCAV